MRGSACSLDDRTNRKDLPSGLIYLNPIKQDNSDTASSVPYLGRIPGLRWLFGSTSKSKKRTELLVLITPRVVTSNSQARQVTDDYRQQLQLIKPRQ